MFDDEHKIAQFIGKDAGDTESPVGVDAALDFPLFFRLPSVAKGFTAPSALVSLYRERRDVQRNLITSYGDASAYFVTFLDNHDMRERFHFDDASGAFDDQTKGGLGLLFTLLGFLACITAPNRGSVDAAIATNLCGRRFGAKAVDFGVSPFRNGVVAFSRLLNDHEVVVLANTNVQAGFAGDVIVDASLNEHDSLCRLLFSNKTNPTQPGRVQTKPAGSVSIHETSGSVTTGPARTVHVELAPAEIQLLRNR